MTAVATIVDEIPIIDSDTHVIEPADLWTSRLSTAPSPKSSRTRPTAVWFFGEKKIYAAGLAAGARWHEYPPDHPRRIADADPRCYDARRRIEHMDEFGVLAQVLYPNIGVFQVNEYIGMNADPQLVLECVQAAERAYAAAGAQGKVGFYLQPHAGHVFTPVAELVALDWLVRWLSP